jgi:hypothetical protein
MSDSVLIYNPEGISIGEYRNKYPELKTIQEFQPLADFELIIVWYFANPTSYYVYKFQDRNKRMEAIVKEMYKHEKDKGENFLIRFRMRTLNNQEDWDMAILRMSSIIPDVRFKFKKLADKVGQDWEELLNLPLSDFTTGDKVDKDGNTYKGKVDYAQYRQLRKDFIKDAPEIIRTIECGYGINKVGEMTTEGQNIIEEFHKNKFAQ